jgi:predicted nucleotidyltransferase
MAKDFAPRKKALLDRAVDSVAKVPGVVAVALGGSHARGTQTPQSNLDIGLIVERPRRFALRTFARSRTP